MEVRMNSDTYLVIFSGVVAIATCVYAGLTWSLVTETKRLRCAQTDPRVSVSIEPNESVSYCADMVVENVGSGGAHDVRFELSRDIEPSEGYRLSEMSLMKDGVAYLAPRQRIRFFLCDMKVPSDGGEGVQDPITVGVRYSDAAGKRLNAEYRLEFEPILHLLRLGEPELAKMRRELKETRKAIESGFGSLKS